MWLIHCQVELLYPELSIRLSRLLQLPIPALLDKLQSIRFKWFLGLQGCVGRFFRRSFSVHSEIDLICTPFMVAESQTYCRASSANHRWNWTASVLLAQLDGNGRMHDGALFSLNMALPLFQTGILLRVKGNAHSCESKNVAPLAYAHQVSFLTTLIPPAFVTREWIVYWSVLSKTR